MSSIPAAELNWREQRQQRGTTCDSDRFAPLERHQVQSLDTLVVVEHQGAIKLWRAPPLAEIDAE
ncbi:MAG TPA: hypothetical protein VMS21_02700 [Methylomirabilota bacterium]|nr:hypothetical protein [Methylomirabilota bacterium]